MTDPITVNAAGAADLLGIGETTVRELTAEGILPSVDLGSRRIRLYSVEALRAWALERSGYAKEASDVEGEGGRGKAVSSEVGRALGRGRPRSGNRQAPLPVRLVPGGRGGEA